MIKLAIVASDEKYLQQLINRLRSENDISLLCTIIVKNPESEAKQTVAFMKKMIEQQPDILLSDQVVVRDVAALYLKIMLDYKDKLPNMKIIIVGERFIEENVMAMMQGGARGFFRFALSDEQFIKCIRVVAQGEIWIETKMITPVFNEFIKEFMKKKDLLKSLGEIGSAKLDILSPREMEVMALISHSMTNEEIADKLFLSAKTVKTHLRNIFQKVGIKNRVEAALLYARHTLISH